MTEFELRFEELEAKVRQLTDAMNHNTATARKLHEHYETKLKRLTDLVGRLGAMVHESKKDQVNDLFGRFFGK